MFLHELSNPQRDAFLTLAARLMSANAEMHDNELAILTLMREEMDMPATWRPRTETTAALLGEFDSVRSRSVTVVELLRVAHSDHSIASEELAFIQDVSREFGFGFARVRALARWLARYNALLEEGDQLLDE